MIAKLVKYVSLILVLWNIPGFLLTYFGASLGSISSYASSLVFLIYFILIGKWHKPALPFVLLGLLYFSISGLNYSGVHEPLIYMKDFLRFMIVIFCVWEVLYRTEYKELYLIILIGAISIIINALVFPESNLKYGLVFGRFSGFYLNPNAAGGVCLIGFGLSYAIKSKLYRYSSQFAFTLAGIFTLSRTFVVVWLFINFLAVLKDKKNATVPVIGALVMILVFTFTDTTIFASSRFEALSSFFDDGPVKTETLKEDSRDKTWALYYDLIFEKPLFGHGYLEFQRRTGFLPGVHNTYLMVIGESGIIPFLILVGLYGFLLIKSLQYFDFRPELFYTSMVLVLSLLVGHYYFFQFFNVLMSMYIYLEIKKLSMFNKDTLVNDKILKTIT